MILAPSSHGLILIRSAVFGKVPAPALRTNLTVDPGAVFARHFIASWTSLSGPLTAWSIGAGYRVGTESVLDQVNGSLAEQPAGANSSSASPVAGRTVEPAQPASVGCRWHPRGWKTAAGR
jgi:hypothetical protein